MLFHIIDDTVVLLAASLSCNNPEKQVRSVKPSHHSNRIVKSKRSHYIIFTRSVAVAVNALTIGRLGSLVKNPAISR